MTFWNGVLWLHLLAMAFFVGGQLMLGGDRRPGAPRRVDGGAPLRAAARRFGFGTLIAVRRARHHRRGDGLAPASLERLDTPGQAQPRGARGLLIVAHMRRPEWHVLDAAIFLVSLAIVWLGIVVAG